MEEVLFTKNNVPNNSRLLNEIRSKVMSHGDSELINDFVYQNYPNATTYFDDDLEKTAYYLETLSLSNI